MMSMDNLITYLLVESGGGINITAFNL